ncbi:WecB/TagA/CpsF family glycosyltransferase [Mariniphaga sp.]|uniref:WecB/TagA/CpsF family glycosyltransferase n=1 Tax=Mariniphaga sp. TaxID=1954475 RepID=UPI00356235EC
MNTEKGKRFKIQNIAISVTNIPHALTVIEQAVTNNKPGYICVTNARTVHLANHNGEYCRIQNNSLLTVPDGAPLVWIARNKGFKDVGKVSGKDLMDALFAVSAEKGFSHYFYGSTSYTITQLTSNLQKLYPGIQIKGAVSPPFQALDEFDIDELVKELNQLQPTFFWCGLGAPKQERLNALLQPKLNSTICVGVGLAFEYIAGTVKRAPKWMQKTGLEWLFRLLQQPKNISRAIVPLSWIFIQLIKSILSKKKWLKNH